jgi:4-carboxymuconolactone decarboxylase
MNDKTKLETGMQTRREVLGAEHVDRSLAQASEFARPMPLTNGVTPDEIQEALLQAAIYCGVPAAMDAQRTAESVLSEHSAAADSNRE